MSFTFFDVIECYVFLDFVYVDLLTDDLLSSALVHFYILLLLLKLDLQKQNLVLHHFNFILNFLQLFALFRRG